MEEACLAGSLDPGPQIWTPGEGRANAAAPCLVGLIPLHLAAGASLAVAALRISCLVGWLTKVVCAEFLSKEGEEMPATHQRGEILLWRKQLLPIPLYWGLSKSQKQWGLARNSLTNHVNGMLMVWSIRTGEHVIECRES